MHQLIAQKTNYATLKRLKRYLIEAVKVYYCVEGFQIAFHPQFQIHLEENVSKKHLDWTAKLIGVLEGGFHESW